MQRRFAKALRTGAYLRIVQEGVLEAGDAIELGAPPGHGVTVGLIAEARLRDRSLAPRMLAAPQLPEAWREWAQGVAAAA
jgi:MOSC domain-containing protein YiiM